MNGRSSGSSLHSGRIGILHQHATSQHVLILLFFDSLFRQTCRFEEEEKMLFVTFLKKNVMISLTFDQSLG